MYLKVVFFKTPGRVTVNMNSSESLEELVQLQKEKLRMDIETSQLYHETLIEQRKNLEASTKSHEAKTKAYVAIEKHVKEMTELAKNDPTRAIPLYQTPSQHHFVFEAPSNSGGNDDSSSPVVEPDQN